MHHSTVRDQVMTSVAPEQLADAGRRLHYGEFYGLKPLPGDGRPLLVVHGNCQAEALRVLLSGAGAAGVAGAAEGFDAVRMPPVHELEASDLPHLHRLLARTFALISQPVRDDYRGLPLGTAQVAQSMPSSAVVLRVPIVRYLGLHPYLAIVRHPRDPSAVPPVVPYHDLRIIAAARDGLDAAAAADRAVAVDVAPEVLRDVGELSLVELRRREAACDVAISDVLAGLGAESVHTLNHPGNAVLIELARRVQQALGVAADAQDPGRVLLGGVRAPRQAAVLSALGLPSPAEEDWIVGGRTVPVTQVVPGQLPWYRQRPEFVEAGLVRHAERVRQLGL